MNEQEVADTQAACNAKYSALFECMIQGVFWELADGTLDDINPAALRMFGLSREEFRKRTSRSSAWDVILEDGTACVGDDYASVLAVKTGQPVLGKVLGVLNEQTRERVWVEVNAVPEFRAGETVPFRVMVTMHDITERKRTEQSIRENEAFQQDIFERNQAVKLLIDPESGRIVAANTAACDFYGYSRNTLTALNIWDINTLGEAETRRRMAQAQTGKQTDFEFTHRLATGEIRDVQVYSGGVNIGGQMFLHSIILDVTERKMAERALQAYKVELEKSNQILTGILEHTHVLACLLDAQFNFVWVNRAYAISCGYSPSFFAGKNHFDLYPDSENEAIFKGVVDSGTPFYAFARPFEFPDQPDRGTTYRDWSLIAIRDESGVVTGLVLTLTEVTGRIRQEKELRLQSLVLDQIKDQVLVTDFDGVITYVNQAQVNMLGMPKNELVGSNIFALGDDPDRGATQKEILETTLREGEWRGEVVNYAVDGSEHIMDCRTQVVHDADGSPLVLCGIATDITARKQAEEMLRTNERNLQTLFAAIHESVCLFDNTGKILTANDIFAERLGRQMHECVGEYIYNVVPPEVAMHRRPYVELVLNAGVPVEFDDERDGRWLHHRICPTLGQDGSVTRFAAYTTDITERRQAEEALKASEDQFRQIVERSNDVFYRRRIGSGLFEYVSPKVESLLGLTPEEVYAMDTATQRAHFHPDDLPHLLSFGDDLVEMDLRGGEHLEREFRMRNKQGEYRWIHGNYTLIRDANGMPDLTVGSLTDVTERKRAEEALRSSEQRFRTMIQNTNDILVILDKDGVQTYVSDSVERATGFTAQECMGRTGFEFLHPDDVPRAITILQSIVTSPEAIGQGEYRHRTKDGGWVNLEAIGKNWLHNPDINGVVLNIRNVTDRKRIEDALRESEYLYRELVENANSIIIRIDREGRILFFNEFAQKFFGFAAEEIVGRNVVGTIVPEMDLAGRDLRAMILDIGRYTDQYAVNENENILRDGSRVWIAWTNKPLLDAAGNIREILCVGNDVTSRKRADEERLRLQDELVQAQKMESVGRLAGGVAHDFNNMLGVILGMTELALEQVSPEDRLYHDLKEIEKAAERSADLTRQLLAFARKQTVTPKVLNLNETIEGALKLLERLIGEDVELVWLPGANVSCIKMDPSQLDQILANLCINARDAIGDVGRVTIETSNAAIDPFMGEDSEDLEFSREYVLLKVSDNGCGMAPEAMEHLFEPFFTTKKQGEGTGLGLATVYGAVKQNNGYISVKSEPGQGATFKIYLPIHSDDSPCPNIAEVLQRAVPEGGRGTILIVEDEAPLLRLGANVLAKLGYTVLAASTPGEALRLAEQHAGEIDLLLTDIVMPEMNGLDLSRRLRGLYPGVKELFMSGYTADVIAHHGVLDDDVHFIQKPFAMRALAEKVRKVLAHG